MEVLSPVHRRTPPLGLWMQWSYHCLQHPLG